MFVITKKKMFGIQFVGKKSDRQKQQKENVQIIFFFNNTYHANV